MGKLWMVGLLLMPGCYEFHILPLAPIFLVRKEELLSSIFYLTNKTGQILLRSLFLLVLSFLSGERALKRSFFHIS